MQKHTQYKLTDNYQKVAVALSLLLFFISFTTTAFYIDYPDDPEYSSAFVFGLGWMGFMAGNFLTTFLWLANPLYILAIILSGFNKRASALIGLFTVAMALGFLAVDAIATSESGNGPLYKITTIGIGYWLWLAAIVILTFGNLMSYVNYKNISA